MPLYEYECDVCGHRFEVIQKFSDLPIEKCPSCTGAVHKLQSAPAFQFKGSGWYITDYAKKDHGKEDTTGAASPEASKDKAGEKTEKADTGDKTEKAAKGDRTDKSDKTDKTTPAKSGSGSETSASSGPSSSGAASSPSKGS